MKRRMFMAVAAASAGCRRRPRVAFASEPPKYVRGWRRTGMEIPHPAGAPELAAALEPEQWIRATYAIGRRLIEVNAFAFMTAETAIELFQRYSQVPGAETYTRGNACVVCSSETEGEQEVRLFNCGLMTSWP